MRVVRCGPHLAHLCHTPSVEFGVVRSEHLFDVVEEDDEAVDRRLGALEDQMTILADDVHELRSAVYEMLGISPSASACGSTP